MWEHCPPWVHVWQCLICKACHQWLPFHPTAANGDLDKHHCWIRSRCIYSPVASLMYSSFTVLISSVFFWLCGTGCVRLFCGTTWNSLPETFHLHYGFYQPRLVNVIKWDGFDRICIGILGRSASLCGSDWLLLKITSRIVCLLFHFKRLNSLIPTGNRE